MKKTMADAQDMPPLENEDGTPHVEEVPPTRSGYCFEIDWENEATQNALATIHAEHNRIVAEAEMRFILRMLQMFGPEWERQDPPPEQEHKEQKPP